MPDLAVIDPVRALIDCCAPPARRAPLPRDQAERLAEAIAVLADPARLQLLSILAAEPDGEACVCDLIQPLGLSQPTVSHHLKVLHDSGLVEREQRGRWAYYRLVPERLSALRRALPPDRDPARG